MSVSKIPRYCDQCGDPIPVGSDGCNNRGCRKPAGRRPTQQPPPSLDGLKAELAEDLQHVNPNAWPDMMPGDPTMAVDWFIDLVAPEHKTERPAQVVSRKDNSQAYRWQWPYEDRLRYLLRAFICAKPKLQRMVVVAREDGVYWRGDGYDEFMRVIDETERMRSMDPQAYRREAIQKLKNLELGSKSREDAA